MDRRTFLGAGVAAGAAAYQGGRKNILLITADDLGPMLSCYGETRIATPHMDKLAGSGVRFQTAYVTQASCSPSRSSMFTGLYPHGTGQYGLANTGFQLHTPLQQATIPNVLKRAGYRTGIIGKLHVEPEKTFQFDYSQRGQTRTVREAAGYAGKFMREGSDPFFLMMNFTDPHAQRFPDDATKWFFPAQVEGLPEKPIAPSERTVFPFQGIDSEEQRERVANYYNCVLRLDAGIGMLMEELKRAGKEEDTVVLFVGDHGPPFARGKTSCYEGALRIPFLARWPGVSKPVVSKALVSTVDLAPTIYDAAGVQGPVKMHGRSLRPVLTGSTGGWREYLGGEFHFHGNNPFYPRRAIRDQRYKLIHNLLAGRAKPSTGIDGDSAFGQSRDAKYDGTPVRRAFDTFANPPEFELYDLEKDPVEFQNLAGSAAGKAVEGRMKKALDAWRKETEDPFVEPAFLEDMFKKGAPAARRG
ncbi:MAG: sulfatase [Bryobacterales bacterium]|nr:sulfatase [Bryobacterales bacterium]